MKSGANALITLPNASDDDIRDDVNAELLRIISDPLFSETTRMKRFLTYVVTEALEGRADRIKGYSLGVEVFDRPDDFDPQADTIVRVQAGQLRRRLDLYYASAGQNNPVRIIIPKGTYAPIFEVRKPALATANKEPKALAAVMPIERQNRPGIAVLTFRDLTPAANGNYFAEGLTVELVNALVQFRYLRIVARTGSVMPSDQTDSLSQIGEKYGVQFVLSGSIRRVKDLVRISINLISTETGDHVYSKIYDRKCTPDSLFDIQEEIASYVAANVGAPYGAIHRFNRREQFGRRASMDGYDAILKYYEMNLAPTENKAKDLLEEIKKVTKKTPRFSSAWAVQALLEVYIVTQSVVGSSADRRLKEALKDAQRAAAIDPENGLAFMALFAAQFHSGDIKEYRKSAIRAIALNPFDYVILAYYAVTAAHIGDWDDAFSAQKAALSLVAIPPQWFYATTLFDAINKGKFKVGYEALKDLEPEAAPAWAMLHVISCMGHLGLTEQAKPFLEEFDKRDPHFGKIAIRAFEYWNPAPEFKKIVLDGCKKAGMKLD